MNDRKDLTVTADDSAKREGRAVTLSLIHI